MAKMLIGCGYLGRRMAAAWLAEGDTVFATTRSAAKANELRAAGIQPIVADITAADSLTQLPAAVTIVYAVGFDRSQHQTIEQVFAGGLRNVLNCVDATALRNFFYISSTGVYGQHGGQWVDERSACQPARAGGQACLAAENLLRAHSLGPQATILRLAGLYGPGRVPRMRELSEGLPLDIPTDGFLNLIHVDDVVRVILALESNAMQQTDLLLVSDGVPVQRKEYYREVAQRLGAPPPRFRDPNPDLPASQRAAGSDKRVSNRRLLESANIELLYPSYREGLAAILGDQGRGV